MEDIDLLARINANDREAFNALFLKYYSLLTDFCKYMGAKPEDGKDVIADVFLDLWVKREKLQVSSSLKSYLYGAVRNKLFTLSGKNMQMQLLPEEHAYDHAAADELRPDEILLRKDRKLLVERFIHELPEQGKVIFLMSWQHQLDHYEIAQILNISPNTVKTHLYRALNYFRKRILFVK
ncbi:RNA polymerase sigma factor [Mucilaginibacter flavus]|uniref:RNA polymerase sigma factor n=1 Tax=Mucilaginibacter flavus TaxID=931504 RepID=UPI0025B62A04|nr:sigma-70 family RNA polymerase sigma factor [Mucilaginibacter flavus]MDN3584689.1 sigma-70 family RNA polymerase sigma factor [Mucilaginibacter flavus]